GNRVATVINNWIARTRNRSNLFYLQSDDMGKTWQTADGKNFVPPIREVHCPALVRDFWSEGLQVYVQHLTFDQQGRPAILFLNSPAGQTNEGPGWPRIWRVAHWDGARWQFRPVTTSGHNFDCGSLYIEEDGTWRIIGPTEPGPQLWRSGGEVVMWTSRDEGRTWKKFKQLTRNSQHNHCYVRQPVNAHPDFYALWADGHGRDNTAPCPLYFCTKSGAVRVLPLAMETMFASPTTLEQ
ncbi:MAG: BNR repeat-containing protein, partial [Verrucomicrobiae bacterium]|nr:BNR repeat-containing protein [Verrucomicrobiae bacterium]